MTQHSSENLIRKAALTHEATLAVLHKATFGLRVVMVTDVECAEAVAHAQRVKMAQEVVAWLRAMRSVEDTDTLADALQAQLEAEAQK